MSAKIKMNDEVIVLTGRDRGRKGKVLSVQSGRVVVQNVNLVSHFIRSDMNSGIEGGIHKKEASIHVSNVALLNPVTNKADRVGFKFLEDGRKVRVFKSSGEVVGIGN